MRGITQVVFPRSCLGAGICLPVVTRCVRNCWNEYVAAVYCLSHRERLDKRIYFNFVCFARMLCIDGGHARFCYCHRADFVFFFLLFLLCAHVLALYEKVSFFFPPRVHVFFCPSCTVMMMMAMFAAPSSPHPHLPRLCLSPPHVCM